MRTKWQVETTFFVSKKTSQTHLSLNDSASSPVIQQLAMDNRNSQHIPPSPYTIPKQEEIADPAEG